MTLLLQVSLHPTCDLQLLWPDIIIDWKSHGILRSSARLLGILPLSLCIWQLKTTRRVSSTANCPSSWLSRDISQFHLSDLLQQGASFTSRKTEVSTLAVYDGIRFIVTLQPSHCCSAEVSAALSHLSWPTQSLRVEILPTSLVNLLFKCRKMSRETTGVAPTILLQSVQAKHALHQGKSATSFVCGQATHGDKVPWLVLVLFPVYDHKLL